MKKLPVGIQTFREIIEGGYVYADKTEYIYNLIQGGGYYFLSRPRRFGKSLFIDTIAEVFSGDHTLFEGLWIADSNFDFERHPVIRIDMTQVSIRDAQSLENDLAITLGKLEQAEGFESSGGSVALRFQTLIRALHVKYEKRVVVLVDEYDKPIVDHIDDPEKARANRAVLGEFYGVLKGQDANLRFVLLAGVSKFTKLSLFSKLNNLKDLTMLSRYAGVCGFTEQEFDALLAERIPVYREARREVGGRDGERSDEEIREQIFSWYDGYTWDGKTRVFNPFSLLNLFDSNEYNTYWFSTGMPTFLVREYGKRPQDYSALQGITINENILDAYDIENAPLASLLFQTGFLTVKSTEEGPPKEYALGFPNTEVSESLAQLFLAAVSDAPDPYSLPSVMETRKMLDTGNPEALAEPLTGLYASIPYHLHEESEAYYHSIFLAVMQFLGFRVLGEVSVAKGRIDGVLDRPCGKSYIIEFKYVKNEAALDDALADAAAQIDERGYAQRYSGSRREVFKVAIAVAGRGQVKVRALP